MERKLAAIFSTDVKGYSRLMGDDEEATIRTIKVYREVISSLIEQHHGRVVDSPGDNMLAEFASAVDAVQASVAIQKELTKRNAELEDLRQMEFRIGLNVGDVITDEGRLYGDGVNIAARLEALADPGGICISESVHMQVESKLDLSFSYQGEQNVKNIAKPVRVYKVEREAEAAAPTPSSEPLAELPIPDKPSIAVLPFTNMSNDPEQEYFSDGITDDIITDLSKISGLFVIAHNSTFTYKDQAVEVGEVSKRLGVRYVLEGSVRKVGKHVRINAQLIDAPTGGHVWAERYDRELEDVFALQDEITREIVTALNVKLTHQELERVAICHTNHVEAFDCFLRGLAYYRRYTAETTSQARALWERAIELDPTYADAYAYIGHSYLLEMILQWSAQPGAALEHAFTQAQHALALDTTLSLPHMVLGSVYVYRRQYAKAITAGEQAVALGPNFAPASLVLGETLALAGRAQEAIEVTQKALRLDPHYSVVYLHDLGLAYLFARQYDKAITAFQETLSRDPHFWWAHVNLASSYGLSGQEEAARAEVAAALKLKPTFSLTIMRHTPLKDKAQLEEILTALGKAGLK